ncbi:hypothetical protein APB27_03590 [Pseudomonas aeruginosa]|nr:hypothetical protein APB27_03590 [Pseudomonas aeruginosa]
MGGTLEGRSRLARPCPVLDRLASGTGEEDATLAKEGERPIACRGALDAMLRLAPRLPGPEAPSSWLAASDPGLVVLDRACRVQPS